MSNQRIIDILPIKNDTKPDINFNFAIKNYNIHIYIYIFFSVTNSKEKSSFHRLILSLFKHSFSFFLAKNPDGKHKDHP